MNTDTLICRFDDTFDIRLSRLIELEGQAAVDAAHEAGLITIEPGAFGPTVNLTEAGREALDSPLELRATSAAYQVTITGIMICEHGVDPANGDMDSIYYDDVFSVTAEMDSVRLVPVPASYRPREVREAREGGEE